ncbi:ImmA/IrrE family metallo-endopeptidase [Pseudomonas sp. URMO17WK12:I2]|uniref:ImmA/IrrE family metallo-endopeptidase n=1 Tax=Pseudomonas sp. URMO17WK12:I2 TaxID=1261623 RepID=UPI000DAF2F5F|nr:ImmA/IrrE family metallo-endopeptidase [Pseudomonas sp. URMO17WK12:I2]PZW47621.1 uncharacterized protein DUF955 [Pseudomonas sp. URMO17WK12:I2]
MVDDLEVWTPQRAANRLTKICDLFSSQHGGQRFPVDVPMLALEAGGIFGWPDPIAKVEAVDIPSFEGALFHNGKREKKWLLAYSEKIQSLGRIRFTQAHELGHYILHRLMREEFQCSKEDMLSWHERSIEAEADLFASFLLMPLNDFREQITPDIDIDMLRHCAHRYGVSLTAAALKWISSTGESALLVLSRDGYMRWAYSSNAARRNGAFFRTRGVATPVPAGSLAASTEVLHDRQGIKLPARTWFPYADKDAVIREMKIHSDRYEYVFTILHLGRSCSVWPPYPKDQDQEENLRFW